MSQFVVETHRLNRRFGQVTAVKDVSLQVQSEAVYGFLGPNGAGKTTTIRLLLGLLKPTSGSASLNGLDICTQRRQALRSVGSMVETPSFYGHLTGRENLDITRRLLRLSRTEIERVLDVVKMREASHRRVKQYSLGMKQRLGLARTMLGNPKLLLLDEPTNGLDPAGIREMRDLIRTLPREQGVTVLLSSHLLGEIEQTATHIGLMYEGELAFQGSLDELESMHKPRLQVGCAAPTSAAGFLAKSGYDVGPGQDGDLLIKLDSGAAAHAQAAQVNRVLLEAKFEVHRLIVDAPSLEDIFLTITSGAGGGRKGDSNDPMALTSRKETQPDQKQEAA